jgi:hypothetical protein
VQYVAHGRTRDDDQPHREPAPRAPHGPCPLGGDPCPTAPDSKRDRSDSTRPSSAISAASSGRTRSAGSISPRTR